MRSGSVVLGGIVTLLLLNAPSTAFDDSDQDGIDDQLEMQLATQFWPDVTFSGIEDCPGPTSNPAYPVLFRARHLSWHGAVNTDYIGINYVRLYDQDCGPAGHAGDNESFMVFLQFVAGSWQFHSISATAHWDTT